MNFRESSLRACIGLLLVLFWCLWLWQPERQVRLHQRTLLKSVEQGDGEKLADLLDDQYTDKWGFDKETALTAARQLRSATIHAEDVQCTVDGNRAACSEVLKFPGPIADFANNLHDPFVFTWVHRGWLPWDWKLEKTEQEEIQGDALRSAFGL